MPSEYELSDISSSVKYQSDDLTNGQKSSKSGGMYISTAKGFILAFLAIAVAVGVGIIVHFAGPNKNVECTCTVPEGGGLAEALGECRKLAEGGSADICGACPTQAPPTPCPTAPSDSTTSPGGTTTSAMTTAAPPKIDVRLPASLVPILYTVELQPHMYAPLEPAEFYFNGSVKILMHCTEATNDIKVHVNRLNISEGDIMVTDENSGYDIYESHSFDLERQFLVVRTNESLEAGKNYTLEVSHFRGPFVTDLAGLYLSSYKTGNETRYLAATQMQATDARKALPCFDEPAIKAEFDVTLVRHGNDMTSLSNMPLENTTDLGNGWYADKFQRTPKMSTYLLAFVISDFEYINTTSNNDVLHRAYTRPDALYQAHYALNIGVDILEYFEDYFNITYPLPKLDSIAVPDFAAGAMENWGLVKYRETAMLYEEGVSSDANKQLVAAYVAHELAHMWFGNLVTPSWWDDLWLNEGFASILEYMGQDAVEPGWRMFDQFVVEALHYVFNFDGLISSHPVYVPVSHPDEINEIFDTISYYKGASIIRMMRFFLGEDTFKTGLSNYLKDRAYDAAFHDDLWFALGNQSLADGNAISDVKTIMDTWTLQMNFPVVMVTFDQENQISLKQSRYLVDPTAEDPGIYDSPFGYKWDIPFAYTTSSERRFNVTHDDIFMMRRENENDVETVHAEDKIPAPVEDNWVIGNPMQYGFYRVNYDESNWNALINQLKNEHEIIHPVNRAQIMNDALNLAKSGDLDMPLALRTLEYLDKEMDYIPWWAASGELGFLRSMLVNDPLYGSFRKFMQNKTHDAFTNLTMNNTGATHLESYMRSLISRLACTYDNDECIEESKTLFRQWMDNENTNPIYPDLKTTVYCTAIANGGIEEWEFALTQYRAANLAAEKSRLQYALSCSKEPWILRTYLEMAIDLEEIRLQDSRSVITSVAGNTIGRPLAWAFVVQNWDYLYNVHYDGVTWILPYLVSSITSSFNTQYDYDQLKAFMESKDDLGPAARAFAQALEKTQANIHWMDANVPVIQKWLQDQGY